MKKTKTVLILAAVTGALLLGGCGSEKTKIYEQAGKDLSQGSYKYALEEYQSSIQNGVKLAQSYRGAGIASLRLGKYEDAVKSFTEALNCDKVSKSLRKDILSYRATAELKSGKYEDAMQTARHLEKIFPWMQAVISSPERLPLPWIPTKKPHLTSNRPMEKIPPMIWRSRSMRHIWTRIWKRTEPDIWKLLFLLRPRMPRTTVTEAVSTTIWKTIATQKKSFWKQPRRIIRKHCFFWEWYIWPRMMWKMPRQCTSSIFPQWVIPPRAIMVWHCAISEAEIMIPLLITSQKAFRQLPQTRCRVFCSMRS